jgi:hypothetical protein
MKISDFFITFVIIGIFITGIMSFAGDVFTQTGVTDDVSSDFTSINSNSTGLISRANDIYNSTSSLTPVQTNTGDNSLVRGMFTTLDVMVKSLGNAIFIITDIGRILLIPPEVIGVAIAILTTVLILAIYQAIRGGLTSI